MIELTPKQEEAVASWEAGDVVVTAGPGSGKTLVLVKRIRRLIEVREVAPERILAITFTVKATHQMYSGLAQAEGASEELRKQFESVRIQTIDGFCTKLLRENALTAGIDPEFRMLEPPESARLLRGVITSVLDGMFAHDAAGTERFLRAYSGSDERAGEIEPTKVHSQLAGLVDTIRSHGALPFVEEFSEPLPLVELIADLREIAKVRDDPRLAEVTARLAAADPADYSTIAQILPDIDVGTARKKATKELVYRSRDRLLPAITAQLSACMNEESRRWILTTTLRILSRFEQRKHALGAIDFGDLSRLAIRLLNDEAAPTLSYEHILIDEYQDTSPLQAELIEAVVAAHGKRSVVRFAVGDINQSIYAFRHADPSVFHAFRDRVGREGGQVVVLNENFRSRPEILDAVHRILPGGNGSGVEAHRLQARPNYPPRSEPSVEIQIVSDGGIDAAEWEAGWCAHRLAELIGNSRGLDSEIRWGSCAILLRTQALLTRFAGELRRRGVPYRLEAGKGFYAAPEIHEAAAFLRALRNPRDEISLAAVLKSAFVGVGDGTLLELKATGLNLAEAIESLPIPGEDGMRLFAFRKRLSGYRAERETSSPDRILAAAVSECGYEAWLRSTEGGTRAVANVHKLLRILRTLAGSIDSFDGVSAALDELLNAAPTESEADEPFRSNNALELLTMHSAKGMEFPAVVVAGLQYSRSHVEDPLTFSPERGIGVKWRSPIGGKPCGDPAHSAVEQQMRSRDSAETDRLFYVAATRAEQHLLFSCSFSGTPKNQGFCELLFEPLGIDHKVATNDRQTVRDTEFGFSLLRVNQPAPAAVSVESNSAPSVAVRLTPRGEFAQQDSSATVSSVALFGQCPRKYYLSRYLGLESTATPTIAVADPSEPPIAIERDRTDATSFGQTVHEYLAGLVADANASPLVRRLAAGFHDHELGVRASRADKKSCEQSFLFAVDDYILRGQVDLLFEEGGERILVDYKTDQIGDRDVAECSQHYELQVQLYAEALASAGQKVDRGILFFLRASIAHEVDVGPDARMRAREAVAMFFEAQGRQEFSLKVGEHCRSCKHFGGACPAELPTAGGARQGL